MDRLDGALGAEGDEGRERDTVGRSVGTDRLKIAQNGDPWVGRSDTQITLSTSHRHTL